MTDRTAPRALRSDVERNRAALLAAARETFARVGFHAPLEPIASAAGVGNATLYRHFPTRDDLWDAVLYEPLREVLDLATASLEDPDAWAGLVHYLEGSCAMEAGSGGFTALMTTRYTSAPRLAALRLRIQERVDALVERARIEGAIRSDIVETDFAIISIGMARVIESTRTVAPEAWRRHLALVLDGLRTASPTDLSAPPLKPNQVWRALAR